MYECGGGVDIGFYKQGSSEFFNGIIYYLEVYDVVFTADEVKARFTKGNE